MFNIARNFIKLKNRIEKYNFYVMKRNSWDKYFIIITLMFYCQNKLNGKFTFRREFFREMGIAVNSTLYQVPITHRTK